MRKIAKKIVSCVMVAALSISLVPISEGVGIDLGKKVEAATNPLSYPDNYVVDRTIISDMKLMGALSNIIGKDFTFKQLKEYNGNIDLSSYPEIESVKGLGYAYAAKSIDLSKLDKLKKIEKNEFQSCTFSSFKLPSSVTEIGEGAFRYCENLTTINLPSGLKTIEGLAFDSCKKLDNITLPSGIEKIGNSAFSSCTSLRSIVIPDGINASTENAGTDASKGIGTDVFFECEALTSVTLGAGMTAIPVGFLQDAKNLKTINIPEKIISIRENAFRGSGLTSLDISKNTGLTTISKSAFSGCSALRTISLPISLEKIESNAFANCGSIESLLFLKDLINLKTIEDSAFLNIKISKLILPGNLQTLGKGAFYGSSITTVEFKDYTEKSDQDRTKTIGMECFKNCKGLTKVILPTERENDIHTRIEILDYAFENCLVLSEMNFPKNLKKIGNYAFKNCADTWTDWNRYGSLNVDGWYGTEHWVLPEDVHQTAGVGSAHQICSDSIPEYYQIGTAYISSSRWFPGKPTLAQYAEHYGKTQEECKEEFSRLISIIEYNPGATEGIRIHQQFFTGIPEIDLSSTTDLQIGKGAFFGCFNLQKVTLPNDLTVIPNELFMNCSTPKISNRGNEYRAFKTYDPTVRWYHGLKTVVMSDNVTQIGEKAFFKCEALELQNKLPKKIVTIGNSAFESCEAIGKITMPSSIENIGNAAFKESCRIINNQIVPGTGVTEMDVRNAIHIKKIGSDAFNACGFQTFQMNDEAPLKVIEGGTFYKCELLQNIKLTKNVEYVKGRAISLCASLSKLDISDACTLDQDICRDIVGVGERFLNVEYYQQFNSSANRTDYFIATSSFSLSVRALSVDQAARENNEKVLPFYTAAYNDKNLVNTFKIDSYDYTFDENGEPTFTIPTAPLKPMVKKVRHTFVDPATNGTYNIDVLGMFVMGQKASEDNPVELQFYQQFPIDNNYVVPVVSTVNYSVDVTANPCASINTEEEYFISYNTMFDTKIQPEFVPTYSDADMTDVVTWTLTAGEEYVTMKVSDDRKSATFKPTKNDYGTARVKIEAGAVTKEFPIHIVAPARELNLETANIDMLIATNGSLKATTRYADEFNTIKDTYPDKVEFKSSDPNVVKITNRIEKTGETTCEFTAVGVGEATITVKALAANIIKTCKVRVSSASLKSNLFDKDVLIEENSRIDVIGGGTKTLKYAFNETLNTEELAYYIEDESILEVGTSSRYKEVTLRGKKKGTTKIVLYPKLGSKEKNGRSYIVRVDGDINQISLSREAIALGDSQNIFIMMKNNFNQEIKSASDEKYKSITDAQVEFSSSAPDCVSVDNYGKVTAKKIPSDSDRVTITCTVTRDGKVVKAESVTITVEKARVKDISYLGSTVIGVGKTGTIKFSTLPADVVYRRIDLQVTNGDILKYDWNRDKLTLKVTGERKGSAIFTLTIENNNGSKVRKSVKVTIGTINPVSVSVGKVVQSKPKAGKKKVTVRWKKLAGAAGYQVQMSKKAKKGFKTIATINSGSKVKYVKKKLKRKKKYFFRVRAFTYKGTIKVYGRWSAVKKAKVK
ncbi:MAG: leucine-rich repeat domain-containing protein [Eubacterium sp.]|nr:leucine-rich repeat domain-containing protein [Eubacterium sp.]